MCSGLDQYGTPPLQISLECFSDWPICINVCKYALYFVFLFKKDKGTLLKAVNYDGEMFIIEEVELFHPQEPIKILKFSNDTVI